MNAPLRRFLVTGLALLVLTAWQTVLHVPESSGEKTITTEKEFRTKVVGKKLITDRGYALVQEDGSMAGKLGGRELTGEWTWEDGYYCRSVALGDRQLPDDCQMVTIEGDEVTFYRKKGYGNGFVYQIGSE